MFTEYLLRSAAPLPAAGANELPIRSSEAGFYRDQVGSGEAVPGEEETRII